MQKNFPYRWLAVVALLLSVAAAPALRAAPAAAAGNAGEIWGAGYFPDLPLVSHEGKTLRFFSDLIKDKVVAINFIYTSCPDSCALETARLREVQKILGDRVGRDVFIYSISIDPEHDTPAVLKRYADKFEVGPGWLFLTGKESDITLIRKKFGLYSDAPEGEKLEEHSLNHIIGNQKTGQWVKSSPFENPYIFAGQLGNWLHNWKLPPETGRDYAEAPKVRNISKGEGLYRTRCSACHTIGAPQAAGEKRIGPDLTGVTKKRDRAWLTRWLAEPDKMIAEKDPLALALLAAYSDIPMPNLRLSAVEIEALLIHIEEESHRVEHHDHSKHQKHGGHGGNEGHKGHEGHEGHDGKVGH